MIKSDAKALRGNDVCVVGSGERESAVDAPNFEERGKKVSSGEEGLVEAPLVIAEKDESERDAGQQSSKTPGQSGPLAGFGDVDRYDSDEDDDVATSDDATHDACLHSSGSVARHLCDLEGNFFS